jgi:peptide/nickel transport system permease protein
MSAISRDVMTGADAGAGDTPFRRLAASFFASKLALAGLMVLAVIGLVALLAPWIAPQDPYELAGLDLLEGRLPPLSRSAAGQVYWLGTDDQGRDMLSAIFYGLRTSLEVGALSAVLALLIGVTLGLGAAYTGGWAERLTMRLADLQLAFPPILVALILVALLGQGTDKIIAALVAVQWAYYARAVRASALVELRKEYVEAAQGLGLSAARIAFRHVLPNCLPPLIVVVTVQVAHAIALEATLSFLGIGLPITKPSLGLLIAEGFAYVLSGKYWISLFPGIALLIAIVAINLVGDRLREILNPRLQT